MSNNESDIFKKLKVLFVEQNIPPDNLMEFYCNNENEVIKLKAYLKRETKGKSCVFTKNVNKKIHVIALVNITNINEISNQIEQSIGYTKQNNSLEKGNYNKLKGALYSKLIKFSNTDF